MRLFSSVDNPNISRLQKANLKIFGGLVRPARHEHRPLHWLAGNATARLFPLARFGQRVVRPKEWAQVANPSHLISPLPSRLLHHPCLRSTSAHCNHRLASHATTTSAVVKAFASTSPPLVPFSRDGLQPYYPDHCTWLCR